MKPRRQSKLLHELVLVMLATIIGFAFFYVATLIESPEPSNRGKLMLSSNKQPIQQVDKRTQIVNVIANNTAGAGGYLSMMTRENSSDPNVAEAMNLYKSKGGAGLENNPQMMEKAQGYMQRYQNASESEKRKLMEDAKRRFRDL